MSVHILRIWHERGKRWHPVCSCRAAFPYCDTKGAARMAIDAHVMAAT